MIGRVGSFLERVETRLVVCGFEDFQRPSVDTYSPTTSRTGQHLLLSTAVGRSWFLESFDISTAFLQGQSLSNVTTKSGDQRRAGMIPPRDCWDLAREIVEVDDFAFPASGDELRLAWELYPSVYGLGDAPRFFHAELKECLESNGFVRS